MSAPNGQSLYTITIGIDLNNENKPFAMIEDHINGETLSKHFSTTYLAVKHARVLLNSLGEEILDKMSEANGKVEGANAPD